MVNSFGKILSALPVTLNIAIVTMIFSLILSVLTYADEG